MNKAKWTERLRSVLVYGAISLASALVAVLLGQVGIVQTLGLRAIDAQFLLRGKSKPSPEIVLLVIDQQTYDHIPDVQLFWHPFYAEALRAAADGGAKVIGVDIAFTVPVQKWEPDHDRLLAQAASETAARTAVVMGYVPSVLTRQQEWPVPVNMITSALGLAGFVNLTADADSFVRRQELIEAPHPEEPGVQARSLALKVAEKYLADEAKLTGGRLSLAGRNIPVHDRTITINYAGPAGTYPSISLWSFLQAARSGNKQKLRDWVGGKIVLLGVDALTDRFPTPFYTSFTGNRWTTSGVEIHANTIGTLLSGEYLMPLSARGHSLAAAAAATGTVIATVYATGISAGLWITALLAAVLVITQVVFRLGIMLSLPELLIASVCAMAIASVYRVSSIDRKSQIFGRAFRVFVGQDLSSLIDQAGGIAATGSREFVTILFSDIRGFTSFCEERDPVMVIEVLNAYFAKMVSIVTKHGGTVNKFVGDGMLVIFSDRDATAASGDHPSRAVRCGLEMCQADTGFETGVGIHTGVSVIGTVGSSERVEYTVLGDTVNLASRIESVNKEQHTRLLFSEATQRLLKEDVQTQPIGAVSIRGQSRKINLYTAVLAPRSATAMRKAGVK